MMFYFYTALFILFMIFLSAAVTEIWTLILKRDTADKFMKCILALWTFMAIFYSVNTLRNAIDARIETSDITVKVEDYVYECSGSSEGFICSRD